MGVPSISASPSVVPQHFYNDAVAETPVQAFIGRGNLYAFLAENNFASTAYIQFFDAADIADVTVGTTAPDFTFRIPADGAMGRDPSDTPLHYFVKGCVIAVTATRTGNGAPGAPATVQVWSYSNTFTL